MLERAANAKQKLLRSVLQRIVGQEAVIELMVTALFARGHALLVGVPGLAKTLLVSTLAQALDLSFGRVQFTPDLLPADITGTDVLHEEEVDGRTTRRTRFLAGPIFHHLVLADEVNRTPPKTQAALLQAMQERGVTVGIQTHPLPTPFHVFATRNPIEQEGTYPLPEAQLDRFLFEIHVEYPWEMEEREIARNSLGFDAPAVAPVLTASELLELQDLVPRMPITSEAVDAAVRLVRITRPQHVDAPADVQKYVRFGAGPRGSQALVIAAKARALLSGRAAADLEDVAAVALAVLRHRLVLSFRAEADRVEDATILKALTERVFGRGA